MYTSIGIKPGKAILTMLLGTKAFIVVFMDLLGKCSAWELGYGSIYIRA